MSPRPQQRHLFGHRAPAPTLRTVMLVPSPAQRWGRALRRRGWLPALVVVSAAAAGLTASAWMQPVYEAVGSVEAQQAHPAVQFAGAAPAPQVDATEVQTLAEELGSRELVDAVVRQLGEAQVERLQAHFWRRPVLTPRWWPSTAPSHAALTTALLEQLQIAAVPQSRLIQISFRAPQPAAAAGFIQALVAAELQRAQAQQHAQGMQRVAALSAEAEAARTRVDAAQTAVLNLAASHGLADPSSQLAVATQRWQQLAQAETTAEIAGLQQADQLAAGVTTPANAPPTSLPDTPTDLAVRRAEAAAEVNRLAALYQPQAVPLVQARQQLASLDASIADLRTQSREARQRSLAAARHQEVDLSQELEQQGRTQAALQGALAAFDVAQRNLQADQTVYSSLLDQLQQAVAEAEQAAMPLRVDDPAAAESRPVRPRRAATMAYALVLGSLLGLGAVGALEFTDDGLRWPEAAEMGVPLLALLPPPRRSGRRQRLLEETTDPDFIRALESCVASLLLAQGESGTHAVLVSSAERGTGKSLVARELARQLALVAASVLLLDGGTAHNSDASTGLSELLAGQTTVESVLRREGAADGKLWSIPAGGAVASGPSLAVSLASGAGADLVTAARARFDWVVVDGSSALDGPEAGIWAGLCDCCLLVAARGHTSRRRLRRAIDLLEASGSAQLGLLLNYAPEARRYRMPASWLAEPGPPQAQVMAMRERA